MKASILGTGVVGQTIATKLHELGHEVYMGTRNAEETKARKEPDPITGIRFSDWHKNYQAIRVVDYKDLPMDSNIFINATKGNASLDALEATGREKLAGKTILDLSNPLEPSKGMLPALSICNNDSLGETIQREFPDSKVVKSLNTMNCFIMVNPSRVPGDHNVFISGNDQGAKDAVKSLLTSMGWQQSQIIDLGDITTARGAEMILPLWLRLWRAFGSADFNFHINRKIK